jgi:alpha/beta superfamily hydrolase
LNIDGFCLVHGAGGNFYGSTLFDAVAARLVELGSGVLRINTRGHDGISTAVTGRGGLRLGGAYEVVDECRHDIAAWLDWLRQRTGPRLGLIGHSLGAVKCLCALAHEPALAPACVIALSPPRLSHSWFCTGASRAEFLETCRRAEQHVADGNPAALMEVKVPLPFVITAAGYLEKYGPDERYNLLNLITALPCAALMTFGALEVAGNIAFQELPDALGRLAPKHPLAVMTIPEADHFYTGCRPELIDAVVQWLLALDR